MALKIFNSDNEALDIEQGFSIEIEDTSPIYNERGSQTTSVSLPKTKRNNQYAGYAGRLDLKNKPCVDKRVTLSEGVYHRTGKININQYSKGYHCNIGFDESELYNAWDGVSLQSLDWPTYSPSGGISVVISHLNQVYNNTVTADYHIFKAIVTCQEKDGTTYFEYLNEILGTSTYNNVSLVSAARTETFLINGDEVAVDLPEGYAISPFLKVSYILEKIFSVYGYKIVESPFADHVQLSRMVVMNNSADTIVKGFIDYNDLLPECTIIEFLNSLYCRFGLVYFVDGKTKTVRFKFISDMISAGADEDWTLAVAAEPIINYDEPKQLRLSAATNISGPDVYSAAPAADTLDKFLQPYKYIVCTYGAGYLCYDRMLGHYTARGVYKDKTVIASTDFFAWDRGADMGYEDISSVDECLPIKQGYYSAHGSYYIPMYLLGKVHRYTTIESSTVELSENLNTTTPLCFCFSYPSQSSKIPFGSSRCYNTDGSYIKVGGVECKISMTFVGDDGLFVNFWRTYDALLRHANRTIEVDLNLSLKQLLNSDYTQPKFLSGQRFLIDSLRYSVPYMAATRAKLRPLSLLQPYDLSEQLVPQIEQEYTWVFTSNKDNVVNAAIASQVASWKSLVGGSPNEWKGTQKKNEESNDTDKLPFTVPTKEEYEAGKSIFIQTVTYSFDLYYNYITWSYNSLGQAVYQNHQGGGVKFTVTYDLYMKAALL